MNSREKPAAGIETLPIVKAIISGYSLPVRGDHGIAHWARVLENGLRLASKTGANTRVVMLFALFHDSRRVSEFRDDGHGLRGGELAKSLRSGYLNLNDDEFELLYIACCRHTEGLIEGDITLQTCWDADRLDLGRVGITPLSQKLCCNAAREMIPWAHERAVIGFEPEIMRMWGI